MSEQNRQRTGPRRFEPADLDGLLTLPEIARSAEAAAYIRLAKARFHYSMGEFDQAVAIAAAVRASPEGRRPGPLATQALQVEQAVLGARGDVEGARAAHAAMGPDAERCGLPARRNRLDASSSDFPHEAQRWGFEGWAVSEVMVAPDGRVTQTRTVSAYPPFVFGEATRGIAADSRYDRSFVPDGTPCPGTSANVTFRLPY